MRLSCCGPWSLPPCIAERFVGQLGYAMSSSCSLVPAPIPTLEGQDIVSAACGIAHTVVVDKHGVCYGFGWNQHGQLGLGHTNNVSTPTKLALPGGAIVQHVACGGGHTAVVSTDGQVFTTGSGVLCGCTPSGPSTYPKGWACCWFPN